MTALAYDFGADTQVFIAYQTYTNAVSMTLEEALRRGRAVVPKKRSYNSLGVEREAVFTGGTPDRLTYCPRCGQLLQQEPRGGYCRWGCTRFFAVRGAAVALQVEWERHSGLVGPEDL